MNRFDKTNRFFNFIMKFRLSLIFTLLIIIICIFGIHSVDDSTSKMQLESLENAIYRGVVQCYALEGTYPPNLDYLKAHYGLTYDSDKYFVDYQIFSSNMMPDITVIPIPKDYNNANNLFHSVTEDFADEP